MSSEASSEANKNKNTSTSLIHGWDKFKNWERNGAYLRTIGGLLCIAFCLNWAIAGATFAFCFNEYTQLLLTMFDKAITKTWHTLSVYTRLMILLAGILIVIFGSVVSIFLFPIQIIASICSFKLAMDLSVKNMNKDPSKSV